MTAAPPDAAPRPVTTASALYLASAVIAAIGLIVSLVLLPALVDTAVARAVQQTRGQDTGGVDVEAIARGSAIAGIAIGSVFSVVLIVLTVVFARKLLRGRNWARIVLAVFAVLHLFGVVGITGSGALVAILTALGILTAVVAAVLTFLPASNLWFRAMRPVRAPF